MNGKVVPIYVHYRVKEIVGRNLLFSTGAQPGTLRLPRGVGWELGGMFKLEATYVYI